MPGYLPYIFYRLLHFYSSQLSYLCSRLLYYVRITIQYYIRDRKFYSGIRWASWQKDIQTLKADEVFHILPPLWSKEGKDVGKSVRKPVPAEEQFLYNLSLRQKMGLDKNGY